MAGGSAAVEVVGVGRRFGDGPVAVTALGPDALFTRLGPSGCGRTTPPRLVAADVTATVDRVTGLGLVDELALASARTRAWLALPVLALLAAPAIAAPSFDCGEARSAVEKVICADPGLADLDAGVARLYRDALAAAPEAERPKVRERQRDWLRRRDGCADEAGDLAVCLGSTYRERLVEVEAVVAAVPAWVAEVVAAPAAVARCVAAVPAAEVTLTGAVADAGRLRLRLATPTGRAYVCIAGRDGEGMAAVHDGEPGVPGPGILVGRAAPSTCPAARPVYDRAGAVLGWLPPPGC